MKNLIYILVLLTGKMVYGQTLTPIVIASGGHCSSSQIGNLSYTIGQAITPICVAESKAALSSGFQQPILKITETTQENYSTDFEISVYPNHSTDRIFIKIINTNSDNIYDLEIFDLMGRIVIAPFTNRQINTGSSVEVDVNTLIAGQYFIKLSEKTGGKKAAVFKMLKN